ncbi:hypothetical protein Acr_22g0008610 [Actinidia rufa]|uniref:Uncharacterized protein n=1 Tax=Actinidia rufa TaxID=165716 RepID=A0A7J0GKY6_9ERIC|nr:hypothetical protein Acr_22g0008610 [Actinidia rufa]
MQPTMHLEEGSCLFIKAKSASHEAFALRFRLVDVHLTKLKATETSRDLKGYSSASNPEQPETPAAEAEKKSIDTVIKRRNPTSFEHESFLVINLHILKNLHSLFRDHLPTLAMGMEPRDMEIDARSFVNCYWIRKD